jgi:hypothetical protein
VQLFPRRVVDQDGITAGETTPDTAIGDPVPDTAARNFEGSIGSKPPNRPIVAVAVLED